MTNFVRNIRNSVDWINNNSEKNYVCISSENRLPYYEVTGYLIPTLLNYGFKNKAESFANYLVSKQSPDGSWNHTEDDKAYIFDVAQIIDGLSEFGDKYSPSINKASIWLLSKIINGRFIDDYNGSVNDHIYLRVLYCLSKVGVDIKNLIPSYYTNETFKFNTLSHFYGYAFEGAARLGLDCSPFMDQLSKYGLFLPEKPELSSYCFVGLSQIALSLFLIKQYDLGMKIFQFVTNFQNPSGGFYGSTGKYLPNQEISWAVKFYLDAFHEGQKLWFINNVKIFQASFELGDTQDERFLFIKNNVKETNKVLEVGCGKGRYINRLICDKQACDIADFSIYINAPFSTGSCLRLPYEDNRFDVVFAAEVIEHSIFHINAVEECLRVLKPGGKLLIIDKDKKIKFDDLHFGEEWLDFDLLRTNYGAEVIQNNQHSYPFFMAKIIK